VNLDDVPQPDSRTARAALYGVLHDIAFEAEPDAEGPG
jgi:hypothetical protein